jgi:hypothetical protein
MPSFGMIDGVLNLLLLKLLSFSLTLGTRCMMSSVQRAFNADDTSDLFHLPLSHIAFDQLQVLQQRIIHRPLSDQDDSWIYAWGSNIYASTKVYKLLIGHSELHPVFKWIWKNQCHPGFLKKISASLSIRFFFATY